jgi:hypothetical protein
MKDKDEQGQILSVPDEVLMGKIHLIRSQKVMLDSDLAGLYGVETKRLKEQVRRNMERFPEDFMFELTEDEYRQLKAGTTVAGRGSHSKYLPFTFTEHGVLTCEPRKQGKWYSPSLVGQHHARPPRPVFYRAGFSVKKRSSFKNTQ